jgi:ankyrin repeat protein
MVQSLVGFVSIFIGAVGNDRDGAMIDRNLRGLLTLGLLLGVCSQANSVVLPPDFNHNKLHQSADDCDLKGNQAALKSLSAASSKEEINRLDRDGNTPLAYAARSGCLAIVKRLVAAGALVDAAEEHQGWTPLLQAADQHHATVVSFLLSHGAKVNIRTEFGYTPLTAAILGSDFTYGRKETRDETVRVLLAAGADVNRPGIYGWTPLMTAVFRDDANLARFLLIKGADPAIKDEKGVTALDHARERDDRALIELLQHTARR